MNNDEWIPAVQTVPEAAKRLGIGRRSFYKYVYDGHVPHLTTPGGTKLLLRSHFAAVFAALKHGGREALRDGAALDEV